MIDTALIRILALAIAVCGIWMLQAAYHVKTDNGRRIIGGWAVLFVSFALWGMTSGADKGVALGLVAFILIALTYLLRSAFASAVREERPSTTREMNTEKLGWPLMLRRTWAGMLIGPIAGLAALSISTALFVVFKGAGLEHTINLTLVSISFPFLWAGLSVFAGFENRLLRKSAGLVGLGLAPLAYILTVI